MPHAWQSAFLRFFPGASVLNASDIRAFARIKPDGTWRSEYILRTHLLRCLARGRPAPFASVASCALPGSVIVSRGNAQITFSTRDQAPISHLSVHFLGNKPPRSLHGAQTTGRVTLGDPRTGVLADWGASDELVPHTFKTLYPGEPMYGLGSVVGLPNIMDLSNLFGTIYAHGFPGGNLWFRHLEEKQGRSLVPPAPSATICSIWIAKTSNVPDLSDGLVGILVGISNGCLAAYTVGTNGMKSTRRDRGEMTVCWSICPGVPIVSIAVNDHVTQDHGIWAVILNALGEVYTLSRIPRRSSQAISTHSSDESLHRQVESLAWETGRSVEWDLVGPSRRKERILDDDVSGLPDHQAMQKRFEDWDMRRKLEVDFPAHGIVVIGRLQVLRYSLHDSTFRVSFFRLDSIKDKITASAMDSPSAFVQDIPGLGARFLAVGSKSGSIAVFDVRESIPTSPLLTSIVRPVRMIQTKSPQISSLALTALQLVHGGSDGLVQAWDLLASSLLPIRTIWSQLPRRRSSPQSVGAICVDPDPSQLRGLAAIGSDIRYWTYSSAFHEQIKSPRSRRTRRSTDTEQNTSSRGALQAYIATEQQEVERDLKAERKENQRRAHRYGATMLGPETTDAEMMAYAMLLSTESMGQDEPVDELDLALQLSRAEATCRGDILD